MRGWECSRLNILVIQLHTHTHTLHIGLLLSNCTDWRQNVLLTTKTVHAAPVVINGLHNTQTNKSTSNSCKQIIVNIIPFSTQLQTDSSDNMMNTATKSRQRWTINAADVGSCTTSCTSWCSTFWLDLYVPFSTSLYNKK